jgi:hypothetical protein
MRKAPLLFFIVLLGVGCVSAQELPKRKSGQWEITRTSMRTEDQPRTMQLCVDGATDNAFLQLAEGERHESCKTDKLIRDGDRLVVDATCQVRHAISKTHAVITGKFDSAYRVESKSTYNPPLFGAAQGHAVLVAKWTGPCPAGQRPGDMIMPSGLKVNINDEAQAMKDKADAKAKGIPEPVRPPFPNR